MAQGQRGLRRAAPAVPQRVGLQHHVVDVGAQLQAERLCRAVRREPHAGGAAPQPRRPPPCRREYGEQAGRVGRAGGGARGDAPVRCCSAGQAEQRAGEAGLRVVDPQRAGIGGGVHCQVVQGGAAPGRVCCREVDAAVEPRVHRGAGFSPALRDAAAPERQPEPVQGQRRVHARAAAEQHAEAAAQRGAVHLTGQAGHQRAGAGQGERPGQPGSARAGSQGGVGQRRGERAQPRQRGWQVRRVQCRVAGQREAAARTTGQR